MTIKKKVSQSFGENRNHNSFISKGGCVQSDKDKNEFSNVIFRIPKEILEKVDEQVRKKSWMTRTQWLIESINEKLNSND